MTLSKDRIRVDFYDIIEGINVFFGNEELDQIAIDISKSSDDVTYIAAEEAVREKYRNCIKEAEGVDTGDILIIVSGVLDNNKYHDGKWSDWMFPTDIIHKFYPNDRWNELDEESLKTHSVCIDLLERAIESDGKTLTHDLQVLSDVVWDNQPNGFLTLSQSFGE